MDTESEEEKKIRSFLATFVSEHKKKRIQDVLNNRTKYVTVILEDTYNPHNASAVMRTCECLGIQDIHVIENDNEYRLNTDVTKGSSNWVSLYHYQKNGQNNTARCYETLKKQGYKIVATSPHATTPIEQIDISQKMALVFGAEGTGLSHFALNNAQETIFIPMRGFTESFNISVSAALCLYEIIRKLHKSNVKWKLTEDEKNRITLNWYRNIVKRSPILEAEFLKKEND